MRLCALAALSVLASACGGEAREARGGAAPAPSGGVRLAVVLPDRDALAIVDPRRGVLAEIGVGGSPWGVAVAGGRAYVSAARHVAVVDLRTRRVVRRVPYRTRAGAVERGEYRRGGMGVAAAAGGRRVFVGVHTGGRGRLEVLDTGRLTMTGAARVGERPFDVVASRDGRSAYTIDHDSYGVTAVDVRTLATRTLPVDPAGEGAFDKLNWPMRSRIHQVALSRGRLLTVGAESLDGGRRANLSIFDVRTGRERILPLRRPHEDIAVGPGGTTAYLTGGYTRGGWRGLTSVPLAGGPPREQALPAEPLGVDVIRPR